MSPSQATYILERLVRERRVSPREISRYLADIDREISSLEQRLNALRSATGETEAFDPPPVEFPPFKPPPRKKPGRQTPGATVSREAAAPGPAKGRRRNRPALTPEVLASRQLQGRYLALIRQVPAGNRAQYTKTAKEKGREAAIKEMREALKK
jgi:hypothetical protein